MKNRKGMMLMMLIGALVVQTAGCSRSAQTTQNNEVTESTATADASGHAVESTVVLKEGKYSDEKLDDTWDEAKAVKVELNQDSVSCEGDNVEIDGSRVTMQCIAIKMYL